MTATYLGPTSFEEQHDRLEARVAGAMGTINVATAELVDVLGEVIADGIWNVAGIRSPEHWVMWRAGVSAGRAAALVRMARRAPELPQVMARFGAGELTEDAMRSIARKAPAERDGEIAELAPELLHTQLDRTLRHLPDAIDRREHEPEPAPEPVPERSTRFGFRDDGWWELHSLLPPDDGALAQKALEAARDAEFKDRKGDAAAGLPVGWSDAWVRLAQEALDALDPATARVEARGARFQAIFHVRAGDDGSPAANLHLGPALPDALRRYLLCDATVRAAVERDGELVGITPSAPTVDLKLRHQIEERDRGCRFPGCGQQRWVHVHHLVHREDGGRTVPTNLCSLCPFHHRLHHTGAFTIEGDPSRLDGLRFADKWGRDIGPPHPRRPAELPTKGAAPTTFTPPLGERLDARWFAWN